MTEYDNRGQVSVWKSDSDHPQAPALTGKVIAHRSIAEGETLEISLWKNDSDNPKAPVLKGKIRDVRKQEPRAQTQPPAESSYEDPLPF